MLHAAVVAQLQRMIVEGVLAPGTRLNERMLCDKLGVSRTPLREAFRVLAAKAWSACCPIAAPSCSQLSTKDIAETFEVISGLEAMSGELACARITDDEVNEIRALHFEMLACHAVRDLPGYYRLNHLIHDAINKRGAQRRAAPDVHRRSTAGCRHCAFAPTSTATSGTPPCASTASMIEALDARDGAPPRRQSCASTC